MSSLGLGNSKTPEQEEFDILRMHYPDYKDLSWDDFISMTPDDVSAMCDEVKVAHRPRLRRLHTSPRAASPVSGAMSETPDRVVDQVSDTLPSSPTVPLDSFAPSPSSVASQPVLVQYSVVDEEHNLLIRQSLCVVGILTTLSCSGVIFGWPNLQVMLTDEQVFACNSQGNDSQQENIECNAQNLRLSAMYTVGSMACLVSSFPSGILLDYLGAVTAASLGVLSLMIASLCFVGASAENTDPYFIGMIFFGIAANLVFMPTIQLFSLSFERHKGILIAIINSSYDSSCVVFLILIQLHETYSISQLFLYYFLVVQIPIFFFMNCSYRLASSRFGKVKITPVIAAYVNEAKTHSANKDGITEAKAEGFTSVVEAAPVIPNAPLAELPFTNQIRQPEYAGFLVFFCASLLRFVFYLGTVHSQLTFLGQQNAQYTQIFTIILPCGIVFAPVSGFIIESLGFQAAFNIVAGLSVVHGILCCVPDLRTQIASFVVFAMFRSLLFSASNTWVAQTFGNFTFGRIFGLAVAVSGVFGYFQYPLAVYGVQEDRGYLGPHLIILFMNLIACLMFNILAFGRARAHFARFGHNSTFGAWGLVLCFLILILFAVLVAWLFTAFKASGIKWDD